ncbi:PPE family protein [Mycobacterium sp. E2733]|uniref:PPE family protein n=1 Tax=Mycobacterium sp. E2733 TaxID=1834138 RepID=UPI0027144B83|nr:PPE family protein [Mycobacterium sp. E2733]
MLAAAAAWNGLATELGIAAASYGSVITELTGGPWLGPSAMAMTSAAMPYVTWLSTTATQAEVTGSQAMAAAAAYETAFMATVPPAVIAANRALLATLIATNFLGVNTAAIMATEAEYMEMWAQDAAAMYAYAASSAAATSAITPVTPAPQIVNPAAALTQGTVDVQATGNSTASNLQSVISGLTFTNPVALNGISSGSSTTSGALLENLLGGSSASASSGIPGLSGGLLENYLTLPGWAGIEMGNTMFSTLLQPLSTALSNAGPAATAADGAAAAGLEAGAAADGAAAAAGLGADAAADLGGVAGSVGPLSVPATWGWSAAGLPPALGSVTLAAPAAAAATDLGAGFGFPFMFPPGVASAAGRTTTAGVTGALSGAAAAKFLPRMSVVGTKPAATAGESNLPPVQIPVPRGLPTNGNTPPGYQMVVSYLPVEPAKADA